MFRGSLVHSVMRKCEAMRGGFKDSRESRGHDLLQEHKPESRDIMEETWDERCGQLQFFSVICAVTLERGTLVHNMECCWRNSPAIQTPRKRPAPILVVMVIIAAGIKCFPRLFEERFLSHLISYGRLPIVVRMRQTPLHRCSDVQKRSWRFGVATENRRAFRACTV